MAKTHPTPARVVEETRTLPGPLHTTSVFTTGYRYDSFGRVLSLTYPDGEELEYTYDSGGQVTAATGTKKHHGYDYLKSLDYDKFGQRTRVELGNGTATSYAYDAEDRRLATLDSTLPKGESFQKLSYTYDAVGNLTRQENAAGPTADATDAANAADSGILTESGGPTVQTYTYDNLHRLTKATGAYDFAKKQTDTYSTSTTYDTINNITSKDQRHAIVWDGGHENVQKHTTYANTYAYKDPSPHAPSRIGEASLSYDANGNLIDSESDTLGHPRRQQVWDENNRLACVHDLWKFETVDQEPSSCDKLGKSPTVRFTYDADGKRVVKEGAQTALYPNQNYSTRGLQEFKHVFVGTTRIATKTSKPLGLYEKDQFYYHADHLGSTSFGTDEKGRVAEHLDYFPSGEVWVDENRGADNPYRFSGKEQDEETGYTYHGARYYDARAGLWQSADPALGGYLDGSPNGGVRRPANLDLYGYAYDNPVGYTDPSGLTPEGEEFNLGRHLLEKFTRHHDQAITMAGRQLEQTHPTARVTMDLQSMGRRADENRVGRGWADLILWTDTFVYVWDSKNKGGKAEKQGVTDVKWYVDNLQAQLLAKGDTRIVAAGFDLEPTEERSRHKENTLVLMESSQTYPGKGVITYTTTEQIEQEVPVPVPTPVPLPTPSEETNRLAFFGTVLLAIGAAGAMVFAP